MNVLTRHYVRRLSPSPYCNNRAIYKFYYTDDEVYLCLCDASSAPELGFTKLNNLLHHIAPDRAGELYNLVTSEGFSGIIFDDFRIFRDQFGSFHVHWN